MDLFKDAYKDGILEAILRETASEVLIFEADSLRIIHANPSALHNLQFTQNSLFRLNLLACLAEEDTQGLITLLSALRSGKKKYVTLSAHCRRRDHTQYPVEARLFSPVGHDKTVFIWVANDLSQAGANRQVLTHSPIDLRAIVTHIPAMAYQVLRKRDGSTSLRYVSEQSAQLLGIKAAALRAHPERFFNLIMDEDKVDYLARLAEVDGGHLSFNWEGRIWMNAWKDVKWVSIRVSQRKTRDGIICDGIVLNVTHSKQAEAEIRHSRAQLSALAAHMESVKEAERLNLAREVHDDLGGNLTAIKIGLSWLMQHLAADEAHLFERMAYLDNVVDQTIESTHRIASSLRPPVLEFGIVSAIEWQLQNFAQSTDIAYQFNAPHETIPLEPDAAITVFRIAQEALTNVAKHAHATRVEVNLSVYQDDLLLTITDNGRGIKPARNVSDAHGFGILGMAERAAVLGGTLIVQPALQRGIQVSLRIPLSGIPVSTEGRIRSPTASQESSHLG